MQGDTQMVAKTREPRAGSGIKAQSKGLRKQGAKTKAHELRMTRMSQDNNWKFGMSLVTYWCVRSAIECMGRFESLKMSQNY